MIRRTSLSTLLIGVNVVLLLLAVITVSFFAAHLLGQFASEQALARVSQAAVSAQNVIARSADDTLTSADLLAERTALSGYITKNDAEGLAAYLHQYCATSQLDACAVLVRGNVLAQSGPDLPWAALLAAGDQGSSRFLQRQNDGQLVMGGIEDVASLSNTYVITAKLLDASFAEGVSKEIALPVSVLDRQHALMASAGPGAAIRQQVLTSGQAAAGYLDQHALFLAVRPLRGPTGEVVGVIQTSLAATDTTASLGQFTQTLLFVALGIAVLSALASLLIGRRMSAPMRVLTNAANRIGSGDLVTPVPTAAGAEMGLLATTLEETRGRLLQMTGALRKEQAEAEAIVTGIVEGVFTVDRSRRIRYLNAQAGAMLDVVPEEAIGRFCGDVLHPCEAEGTRPCEDRCPIMHARFQGKASATERLLLPDGHWRRVVVTSAPSADGQQQVQVLRDETDVEASRRLRDTVLANISHEFRTPLSAQLASVELLLDQIPNLSREEITSLVVSLQRGTLRLTQLIDNLLESVRIEAGRDGMRRQTVALDEVIEEAIDMMRPLLAQRRQQVSVDLPYPLPATEGDALRLRQVFVNLLANANKYAPSNSTIQIGGAVDGAAITLWVEDSGPGFPGPEGSVVFERFVRAQTGEPEQSGMGLGLWIAKSVVERHGGQVQAYNTKDGGAHLRITLPAR